MTSQFDFTNSEWSDIAALPVLVGYAVARAEHSGLVGNIREIRTLTHTISDKAPDNAAKTLIEAISTIDVRNKLDEYEEHSAELLGDVAVQACHEIARLLDGHAEPAEAAGYKHWVVGVGEQVANAAKEHGVRVSPLEEALLQRIVAALEL